MRNSFHRDLCLAILLTCSSGAFCVAVAQAFGSGQNGIDPVLPAPKADNGVHFAPGIATQGTAVNSAALGAIPGGDGCSPPNHCAVVTPALAGIGANSVVMPVRDAAQDAPARGGRGNSGAIAKADAEPTAPGAADAKDTAATRCGRPGGGAGQFGRDNGQASGQANGEGRRGGGANAFGSGFGSGLGRGQASGEGRRGGDPNAFAQRFAQGNGEGRRGGGTGAFGPRLAQGNGEGRRGGGGFTPGQGGRPGAGGPCFRPRTRTE